MHCPNCGKPTVAGAAFCHQCGARLEHLAGDAADGGGAPPAAPGDGPAASSAPAADRLHQALTARHDPTVDNEDEVWRGQYSPRAMVGRWLGLALLTIALLVAGIWINSRGMWPGNMKWLAMAGVVAVVFCYNYTVYFRRRLGVRYRLTSQRLWLERGVLGRTTDRIDVVELEDIRCVQGFVERMAGVGDIYLRSRDHNDPEVVLRGIEDAPRVAALIDQVRRKEQIRRGMLIEQT